MYVTIVTLHVKPGHIEDFLRAVRVNHEASVREPGNLRFDVLRSQEDPCRFVLYEAYATAQDAAAHRLTPHFQAWQETVPEWFSRPRTAAVFDGLHPG